MSKAPGSIPSLIAATLLLVTLPSLWASASPADIVNGVSQIVSPGTSGPMFALSSDWVPVALGDEDATFPSVFVAARDYGSGRVAAMGHEGLLLHPELLDNGLFLTNLVKWLDVANARAACCTSGHRECVTLGNLGSLKTLLAAADCSLSGRASPITISSLTDVSVLIIGNAWSDFSAAEKEAIRQFVENGGGLLLVGLGWSWEPYNPGKSIEDYPMTKLAAPYGIRWLKSTISDPTNQYEGSPVFHLFYPSTQLLLVQSACDAINSAHATYGTGLASAIESDEALRKQFTRAHALLAVPSQELPQSDNARVQVYDFYRTLITAQPASYARVSAFNPSTHPTSAWIRERAWRTWRDCLDLTEARKAEMASTGQLSGRRRDILDLAGVVVQDNQMLDNDQLDYIYRFLTLVPSQLHDLRSLWVLEFLGTPASPVDLNGLSGAINIFGCRIGTAPENSFPSDVAPGIVGVFTGALAHELNHVVDAYEMAREDGVYKQRRGDLISRAGNDHMNYLRSMVPDGVFVSAPYEFFASISNEWFTDSAKTIELGLLRFAAGRPEPLNQALFFADVYSQGGNFTYFYWSDMQGNLLRREVPLARNASGRICEILVEPWVYSFDLDANGWVTGVTKRLASSTSIDEAKRAAVETLVRISGACVSASFPDFFYVESDDRYCGIRVSRRAHGMPRSVRVGVWGCVATDSDGERFIEAATIEESGSGSIRPLCVNNRGVGGGGWSYDLASATGQAGVAGASALNTIGLFLRTFGRATAVGAGYIYLDDGSRIRDGTKTGSRENIGVRVVCDTSGISVGDQIVVDAISSCFLSPSRLLQRLLLRVQ